MRRNFVSTVIFSGLMALAAAAQTPFTYQGQVKQNGQPFTGNANITFSLYDGPTGFGFIGDEVHNSVPVSNGLFTTEVGGTQSWDNQFSGDLWMELNVNGQTLSPREKITAVPRAITAKSLVLPFDSTPNNYSSSPLLYMYNQGSGGGIAAETSFGSSNAIWAVNSAANGGGSAVAGFSNQSDGYAVSGSNFSSNSSSRCAGGYFTTQGAAGIGVWGRALNANSNNTYGAFGGYFEHFSTTGYGAGVVGTSPSVGNGYGVQGWHTATSGYGVGVYGYSGSSGGYGGYFTNAGGGTALYVNGTTKTKVLEVLGGSDIAEPFNINQSGDCDGGRIEPGMVVSIDANRTGELTLATKAYDRAVAGIISGANGVNPGMILTQKDSVADGKHAVAMTGRVWCWCDADANGAIKAGDLLTTSNTPGHAMRVGDDQIASGATIGKAMSALEHGTGMVLVLVNLQ